MIMSDAHAACRPVSRPLLAVAAVFGVLVAFAGLLWAHYGTAVFFDMIAAGIAACF
jgi:hypothetical protein